MLGLGLALALWGLVRGSPRDHGPASSGQEVRPEAPVTAQRPAARQPMDTAPSPTATPDRARSSAADLLLYAISSGTTGRFPRPTKTEIHAVDPRSGESHVVFSDANQDFILLVPFRSGVPTVVLAATGRRAFAHGNTRRAMAGGYAPDPGAFYELATDGSNRARELFRIQGDQTAPRNVFVSPAGDKLGYINDIDAKWFVFVHDTETGTLLSGIPLEPILSDGFVRNIGFMLDGERIFFTGETGDIHVTSEESYARVGTWLMSLDGSNATPLSDSIDGPGTHPDFTSLPDTPPTMLAEMPDGRYLFSELQFGAGASIASTFYFLVDPETGAREAVSPDRSPSSDGGFNWSKPSTDGAYLAFSEIDRETSEETLRALDLRTGGTRTVLTHPIEPLSYPVLSVVGWVDGRE